ERISSDPTFTPLTDALQSLNILHQKAGDLNIDINAIGIMGFSAGGHLAASASTLFHLERFKNQNNRKPAFSILMYPVISMTSELTHQGSKNNLLGTNPNAQLVELFSCEKQVSDKTPPTFILHATDDMAVVVDNTHTYVSSLERFNIPHKKVIFDKGGHGFGFREGAETNKWTNSLEEWLRGLKMIE
ncbi:MAG: alpha/beta hydrolase, partial [Bacteroidales bacterium]|nr:alpha/beta hydrolase [Bacteroidales bacterium]